MHDQKLHAVLFLWDDRVVVFRLETHLAGPEGVGEELLGAVQREPEQRQPVHHENLVPRPHAS